MVMKIIITMTDVFIVNDYSSFLFYNYFVFWRPFWEKLFFIMGSFLGEGGYYLYKVGSRG